MYRLYPVVLLAALAWASPARAQEAELPDLVGEFDFSFYWVSSHRDFSGPATTTLYTKQCRVLARVPKSFAARAVVEGTAQLADGRVINTAGACDCGFSPCFFRVPKRKQWGVGVANRPLAPFRSIAVDSKVVPIGTKLYIPALDGLRMPGRAPWGGFVHDGCVIADDRGGAIRGNEIDFFAGRRGYYRVLQRKHRFETVKAYDGTERCKSLGNGTVPNS